MELRELSATGLLVSPIGFGASLLGHVFDDVLCAVARRALDLGVNFINTSS